MSVKDIHGDNCGKLFTYVFNKKKRVLYKGHAFSFPCNETYYYAIAISIETGQ
jgi:hypothetical protein